MDGLERVALVTTPVLNPAFLTRCYCLIGQGVVVSRHGDSYLEPTGRVFDFQLNVVSKLVKPVDSRSSIILSITVASTADNLSDFICTTVRDGEPLLVRCQRFTCRLL